MKLSKTSRIVLAGLLVQSLLMPTGALAQNDELDNLFEQEEMDEPPGTFSPPPPPPPTDFSTTPPDGGGAAGFPSDPPGGFGGGSGVTNPRPPGPSRAQPKVAKPDPNRPAISAANIEDITDANYPDIVESFDYPNAEITDLVKVMSQLTGKNFILDPGVRGKISIIAPTQITVAEAYKAFLSALAINGFTVVPSGKFLKVKSARNAQRDSIETYSGQYYPNSDIMITRIIHLKHISAEEVNKRLRILPSKDGEMTPYEPTNSLIISDYGANIERIMKIINDLDRPGFEEQLTVIPIRYASAKNLGELINQIINKETTRGGSAAPGGFGAGVPRFRSRGGTQGGGTPEELSLVAPDDRTNALIVVGNKAGIQKVRDLVRKLDYKLDPAEAGGVFVYYVKYGEAEKISQTLSGLAGAAGPSSAPAAGGGAGGRAASPLDRQAIFGGDVKIVSDKSSNSLIITASKVDYETVQSLLAKIDIPRDQVFVEAIIMEMNTEKQRGWNPTYYYFDPSSNGVGRGGFSSGNVQNLINPANDSGTILGFGSGDQVKLQVGTATVTVPSLIAFIQLIQQNTESNILSTPQILALDNEDAEIEVGDKVPVGLATATASNGTTTTSPQFENATIKLQITPAIRPDSDVVRMKIVQQVKQRSNKQVQAQALAQATTVISDRSLKTNIVVHDGDTAILGGLVRDEEFVNETKVPILGDIPVLGWLFKSSTVRKEKQNLVVFITPKIIRGVGDSQQMVSKKANERIDWLKKNFDGRDPYGDKVDKLPRRADANDLDTARSSGAVKTNKKR